MSTITVHHITGYGETTDDGPGDAIIETLTVSHDELADLLGSTEAADDLLRVGRSGWHDEWLVAG